MKKTHALAGLVLGTALLGAGLTNAFAADETLRSLAEKNGIYIGAILNSQWFSGGLPGNYEQILSVNINEFGAVRIDNHPRIVIRKFIIVIPVIVAIIIFVRVVIRTFVFNTERYIAIGGNPQIDTPGAFRTGG